MFVSSHFEDEEVLEGLVRPVDLEYMLRLVIEFQSFICVQLE